MHAVARPAGQVAEGMEPLSYGGTFLLERIVGTVPVEADGSAHFELPAGRALFFVALDKDGMAAKRMQSFMSVQPGEDVSCVGCHEDRTTVPASGRQLAATRRSPSVIEPVARVPEVIDFPRDVQPILDRHCVGCHDYEGTTKGGPMSGGMVLCGDREPMYSHSFYMLTIAAQFRDGRNLRRSNYPPRAIGSSASPLLKKLDGAHHDVRLNKREQTLLRLWTDTGASFAGTYAALGTGSIGDYSVQRPGRPDLQWQSVRDAQKAVKRRCASCHSGKTALPSSPSDNKGMVPWAEGEMNKLATGNSQRVNPAFRFNRHLVYNLSRPEKSLLLLAPLAKSAGGYGVCKDNDGTVAQVFADADDPDYAALLRAIRESKAYFDRIKRFDMPGFVPRPEFIRELKRYGVVPESFDFAESATTVYELERRYWISDLSFRIEALAGLPKGLSAFVGLRRDNVRVEACPTSVVVP